MCVSKINAIGNKKQYSMNIFIRAANNFWHHFCQTKQKMWLDSIKEALSVLNENIAR